MNTGRNARKAGAQDDLAPRQSDDAESLIRQIPALLHTLQAVQQLLEGKQKIFFSVEEFAGLVCRAPFTVRTWVKLGRIEATRVAGTGPRGRLLIGRDPLHKVVEGGLANELRGPVLN